MCERVRLGTVPMPKLGEESDVRQAPRGVFGSRLHCRECTEAGRDLEWGLLQPLSEAERRAILRRADRRHFARGGVLFSEDVAEESLHLILRGQIAVKTRTTDGIMDTLAVQGPGGYLGGPGLVPRPSAHPLSMVALGDVETFTIRRTNVDSSCAFDRILVAALTDEVRAFWIRLQEIQYLPVSVRVYRRLVHLMKVFSADGGSVTPLIPLTRQDIASLAGTSRPSADKVLRTAHREGVVRLERSAIEILDAVSLVERAEYPDSVVPFQ
jgi:CRP/FNR family transcriptional regulator, cyclic AMP receptor protein